MDPASNARECLQQNLCDAGCSKEQIADVRSGRRLRAAHVAARTPRRS